LFRVRHVFLLLLFPLVLAACGSDGSNSSSGKTTGTSTASNGVPEDAAAVVGGVTIPKSRIALYMDQAKINYENQNVDFPKAGSSAFRGLRGRAVAFLTVGALYEAKAKSEGITATDAEVKAETARSRKIYGKTTAAQNKQMKKEAMTQTELEEQAKLRVMEQKVQQREYAQIKVTDADVRRYYQEHLGDYSSPETRVVRQLLVHSKTRAQKLRDQARRNGNFAALAKKYSVDKPTGAAGGRVEIRKGLTQRDFDRVAFSLDTGKVSDPIKTQYGWYILQPVGSVKPASSVPYSKVASTIREHLLETARQHSLSVWQFAARNQYCKGKVKFAPGYAPSADDNPCNKSATRPEPTG